MSLVGLLKYVTLFFSIPLFIKMYYDFNIPYPSNQTKEELERVEKILERIHSSKMSSFYE